MDDDYKYTLTQQYYEEDYDYFFGTYENELNFEQTSQNKDSDQTLPNANNNQNSISELQGVYSSTSPHSIYEKKQGKISHHYNSDKKLKKTPEIIDFENFLNMNIKKYGGKFDTKYFLAKLYNTFIQTPKYSHWPPIQREERRYKLLFLYKLIKFSHEIKYEIINHPEVFLMPALQEFKSIKQKK